MDARAFLTALWGDVPQSAGPFIQLWTLTDKRSEYYASAAGVTVDGQPDVFTGVGLAGRRHGAKQRAKAPEVVAIAGLWLDLDVGPGKIATRDDAFALSNAYAPPTITVDSGNGLHCWYLFERPWVFRTKSEQARARIIAQQWVALHQIKAAESFAHIDSVGDLARLLRIPGTVNAKDPAKPRPVMALGMNPADGPRHSYSDLARHLTGMPIVEQAPALASVAVPGDASQFAAKFDALMANSPEFAARWNHNGAPPSGDNLSAWDLSLCALAAGAMNDADLRALIVAHRQAWGGANDLAKCWRPPGPNGDYIDLTIARARAVRTAPALETARRAA